MRFLFFFSRCQRGGTGVLFALSLLPIMALMGGAIDYGRALSAKGKAMNAADIAALAGVTAARNDITAGASSATAIAAGQAAATGFFAANTTALRGAASLTNASITQAGTTITATVDYSVTVPSYFMTMFGVPNMSFNGTSNASVTMPTYINIYIVIDNSESMGIGATTADQQTIYNSSLMLSPSDGAYACAIACHYQSATSTDITGAARAAGATLRMDVAKQAIYSALSQIPGNSTTAVSIYTMSNKLTNVFPLSTNLAAAKQVVAPSLSNPSSIDLANDNNDGGTNTTYGLTQLAALLPSPGDGLTAATAQGFVILVTDGVQDSDMKYLSGGGFLDSSDANFTAFSPCNPATCDFVSTFGVYVQALDPTQCASLKSMGYTLMTLNATYLIPSPSMQSSSPILNGVFSFIQSYLLSSIPSNMAACASSPQYAYSVSTPTDIANAAAAIFQSIPKVAATRLTR